MAIPEEPNISVPYSDPSINAQYSEFLKGEDLEDKFEAEEPLFETIKDEPVTIGDADPLGLTAGSGLWTLSKKQKEERDKQLTKFTDVPEGLAFDWETGQFGTESPDPLSIRGIRAGLQDTPLFSQDDPTRTVRTPSQAMQEAVQEDMDIKGPSWLELQRDRLLDNPAETKQATKSIWDVVPERPPSRLRDAQSIYQSYGQTGLSSTSSSASGSLSAPPPASLAGQGNVGQLASATGLAASNAGLFVGAGTPTGLGTLTNVGAAGTGPAARLGAQQSAQASSSAGAMSGALKAGTQIFAIWSAKNAFDSGTTEGKISGSMQLAALLNPALAPYVAAYEAIKFLTGWGGIGSWFGGGNDKPPMGGVEYRVTTTDILDKYNGSPPVDGSDQSAWLSPGSEAWNTALSEDKLRITAPYSWGYNGFNDGDWKSVSQKNVDYLYAFADRYGLDVSEDVFYKAALGTGGFEKHKPSGDRNVSVLERVDSIGNGATSANQWLREVMEYVGPNGEKIISGTPRSSNINTETGMYEGFNSQEEFQNDVSNFNTEFYK